MFTGHWEILIIIGIILLLFGPKLIPVLARQAGELFRAGRELKDQLPNADDLKAEPRAGNKKNK